MLGAVIPRVKVTAQRGGSRVAQRGRGRAPRIALDVVPFRWKYVYLVAAPLQGRIRMGMWKLTCHPKPRTLDMKDGG